MNIIPYGECALSVRFEEKIDPLINDQVIRLYHVLSGRYSTYIKDMIPAYHTLTVLYDPLVVSFEKMQEIILKAAAEDKTDFIQERRRIEIPVCYGGQYGEDLAEACRITGLSEQEFIDLHCAGEYRVYMIGFLPGFAYLGGLDERLHLPRKKVPRTQITAGSVGIGGGQTGVYPLASPGGWNLIGRTPLRLFDPDREEPVLLRSGDLIRFIQISEKEYEESGGGVACTSE